MAGTATNKRRQRFEEERASDQFAWDSFRENADLRTVDALTLIHLGRKQAKLDLLDWASRVADEFWEEHRRRREGRGVPKEYGGYGVRIIEQSWTVTIQWYFTKGRGKNRKPAMEGVKSPVGKAYRIPLSRFTNAKQWELEAIARAVDEFEVIRRCSAHLKSMTAPFLGYIQVLAEQKKKSNE